jgi:hypothetical protein
MPPSKRGNWQACRRAQSLHNPSCREADCERRSALEAGEKELRGPAASIGAGSSCHKGQPATLCQAASLCAKIRQSCRCRHWRQISFSSFRSSIKTNPSHAGHPGRRPNPSPMAQALRAGARAARPIFVFVIRPTAIRRLSILGKGNASAMARHSHQWESRIPHPSNRYMTAKPYQRV